MSRGKLEIKRGHPSFPDGICPICGHQGWCFTTYADDGAEFVICNRDTAKQDVNGYKYIKDTSNMKSSVFIYKDATTGYTRTKPIETIRQRKEAEIKRFPDHILDKLNRKLLSLLTLNEHHKEMLKKDMFTEELIKKYNIKSYPPIKERWKIAKELVQYAKDSLAIDDLTGFPGAYIAESKSSGNRYWSLAGYEGIVFPIANVYGEIVMLQVRLEKPIPGKGKYRVVSSSGTNKDGTPRFLNGCSPGARIGVLKPTVMGDFYTAYHTEGIKKAIKVVEKLGCVCITVQGVKSWSELFEKTERNERTIDVLKNLGVKMIIMAYDGDRFYNSHVMDAEKTVVEALKKEGFFVGSAYWDSYMGKGIDDILDNGYKPMFAML